MRICVDATSLLLRSAGVKNYIYYWIRSMQRWSPELEVSAFPMLGSVGELDHERSVTGRFGTVARIGLLHTANVLGSSVMNLATKGVDVFHASNQVHHVPDGPMLTATLYDMTCLLMPENHTAANVRAEQRYTDRVLNRAQGLISISEHTKRDAMKLLSIPPERIEVIYPGVPESFFEVTAEDIARVSTLFGFTKPYLLFVSTIEPRKNVDRLLDAWEQLPAVERRSFELILAGPRGWAESKTHRRLDSGIEGVRYLGYVNERDLPALTAGAAIFVYPSLYEGFGFPIAQAMAAGVPVITSNVSSLPEVARDAALLVDPLNVEELRLAMERLMDEPQLREVLGARGRVIAREYTWENAARRSAAFFQRLGVSR
jgi:glycosyltransferase involved in cell wall biosynthesis